MQESSAETVRNMRTKLYRQSLRKHLCRITVHAHGSRVNSSPGSCSVPARGFRATTSPPSCASTIVLIGVPRSALHLDFFFLLPKSGLQKETTSCCLVRHHAELSLLASGASCCWKHHHASAWWLSCPSLRSSTVLALIQLQRCRILS